MLAGAAAVAADGVAALVGGTADDGGALVGGAAGAGDEAGATSDEDVTDEVVPDVSSVPVPQAASPVVSAVASPTTASIRGPRMRRLAVRRRSFVGELMTPPGNRRSRTPPQSFRQG